MSKVKPYAMNKPVASRKVVVDTVPKLKRLCRKMMDLSEFAFDTETNDLRVNGDNSNFLCVGMSISWGASDCYYIPLNHRREEDIDRNIPSKKFKKYMQEVFDREDVTIVGHNLKFDLHVLKRMGIVMKTRSIYDTMLASWICDENIPKGLKENSERVFGYNQSHFAEVTDSVPKEIKKEFGLKANSRATFDLVLIDEGYPYAIDDAFYTWELYLYYMDKVEEENMGDILSKHMFPFLITLFNMEERGVVVDVDKLDGMKEDMQKDLDKLMYDMTEIVGAEFNANSSKQLGELLFGYQPEIPYYKSLDKYRKGDDKEREKIKKDYNKKVEEQENSILMKKSFHFKPRSVTQKGAPQTNSATLWSLSHLSFKNKRKNEGVGFCKMLMDYKVLEKLKTAFVDGISEMIYDDGKVHCNFNQVGADSGRLSCSKPNLQQLPKSGEDDKYQIRSLFIGSIDPVTGKRKKILAEDYANLEIRVNAHFSKDKRLLEMFANHDDVHGSTAVNMFELDCTANECKKKYKNLRQAAKILNFLLIYGGSAGALYNSLKENRSNPIDLNDEEHLKEYRKFGARSGEDVAQCYIDKYFDTYKGVAKFIQNQHKFARKNGFVYTILKRKRRLPDINSSSPRQRSYCERLSVNAPIQGCKNYETPIITKEYGVVMLGEVAHQNLTVWDGKDFVKAMCLPSGKKKVVEITFSDNRKVICSPNHKYLCKNVKGNLSWKTPLEFSTSDSSPQMVIYNCNEVSDFECISPEDFPIIEKAKSWNTNEYNFSHIDDQFDLGYTLGWLKSDGSVNPNKDISFLFAENKFECRDYLIPVLYKYFPTMYKQERLPEDNRSQILDKFTISSVNLARQASEMEVKSHIPSVVWKSKQALRGYIQACIDADGSVDSTKIVLTLGKGSYYEDFAREFQQALSVFGIPSRLHFCSDRINVYIRKGACARFRDRIGLKHPKKKFALSSVKESISDRYGDTVRVKSVEFKDEEIEMYDIVNSESHKFVADGLITHNSAADITSAAQNRVDSDPWFEEHRCYMIIQVHDELVFECPEEYVEEALKRIHDIMMYPFGDDIELEPEFDSDGDSGDNYAEAK